MNEIFKNVRNRTIDTLNIQVTSSCNYKCGMCPFHGEGYSGKYFEERPTIRHDISTQELEIILKEALAIGIKKIDLTPNGEFFTHHNWEQILLTIKKYDLEIVITTNGGLLDEESIKKLCNIGISHIAVSIDSIDYELYKVIRKPATKQAFQRAVETPKLLKKYADSSLYIQIQITEQPEYPQEVNKILDFYKDYCFNQISVNKMFITTDEGIEHFDVQTDKKYIHGTCKSYGSPILMPDGTVLPCCGAFYFYPKLGDKVPNIKDKTLKQSLNILDDVYEHNDTFKKYCQNCSLYSIGNTMIPTPTIEGKYFVQRDNINTKYFKIPYGLYRLPKSITLWLYKKNHVNKIKKIAKIVGI